MGTEGAVCTFALKDHVLANHLLGSNDWIMELQSLRMHLAPFFLQLYGLPLDRFGYPKRRAHLRSDLQIKFGFVDVHRQVWPVCMIYAFQGLPTSNDGFGVQIETSSH